MENATHWRTLHLGWALLLAPLGACSNEDAVPRDMAAPAVTPLGGSGGQASATAGAPGSPGGAAGSGGAPASLPSSVRLGDPLEFVAGTGEVPYAIGENAYGIRGGAFLARSALGNTVSVGSTAGEICISGSLEEVPGGNYGQYWGVEVGFNLEQVSAAGSRPAPPPGPPSSAADAGTDAGAVEAEGADAAAPAVPAEPWLPGPVRGFSFVVEGPTINLIRFKGLPAGYDASLESSVFCKTIEATSGQQQNARFDEMAQYCWNANANVLIPTQGGLANISWQLPADVAPAGVRPFDWCLRDLRPILPD